MASQSNMTHLIDSDAESTILDAGEQLLLSNLSTWDIEPDNRPFPFLYISYMTVNRMKLCECTVSAGPYYLVQIVEMYNNMDPESNGIFQTIKKSLTCIQMLMDFIPIYDLLSLDILRPKERSDFSLKSIRTRKISFKRGSRQKALKQCNLHQE